MCMTTSCISLYSILYCTLLREWMTHVWQWMRIKQIGSSARGMNEHAETNKSDSKTIRRECKNSTLFRLYYSWFYSIVRVARCSIGNYIMFVALNADVLNGYNQTYNGGHNTSVCAHTPIHTWIINPREWETQKSYAFKYSSVRENEKKMVWSQ